MHRCSFHLLLWLWTTLIANIADFKVSNSNIDQYVTRLVSSKWEIFLLLLLLRSVIITHYSLNDNLISNMNNLRSTSSMIHLQFFLILVCGSINLRWSTRSAFKLKSMPECSKESTTTDPRYWVYKAYPEDFVVKINIFVEVVSTYNTYLIFHTIY